MGLTITAFFEVLAGSLRLEKQVEEKLGLEVAAREAFIKLLTMDPREEYFPWEGTADGKPYELSLFPVELRPIEDTMEKSEVIIQLEQELFYYEFKLFENDKKQKFIRLVRYMGYPFGYFTEKFLAEHLKDPPILNRELMP